MRKLILLVPAFFYSQLSFSQNISHTHKGSNRLTRKPAQAAEKQTLLASPSPKPTLNKGEYLKLQNAIQDPNLHKINPSSSETLNVVPKDVTYFKISKTPKGFVLGFQTKDSHLHLSQSNPITVEFMAKAPLQIQPAMILTSDWPKGALEIPISITGIQQGQENGITVKASYTYCHETTKACTKALTRSQFFASP